MVAAGAQLTAFVLCALWLPLPMGAGNFDFLVHSPVAYLTAEDWTLLRETVAAVVTGDKSATDKGWENAKNGHSGKVTSLKAARAKDGRNCRVLRIDIRAGGYDGSSRYIVCRDDDAVWRDIESGLAFTDRPLPGHEK